MAEQPTITREQFFDPMLLAFPEFEPNWRAFVEYWEDDAISSDDGDDGLPHYLLLSELANTLIEMLQRGATDRFPAIFSVVEDWINHGEHYVSEAAVVGLIEDLTDRGRYSKAKPSEFVPWLGPVSKKWWFEVIDYWERSKAGKFRPLSID